MTQEKLCSKCSAKPARKSDVWCEDCRNTYQRKYRNEREEQIAAQAYARGVSAIRLALAQQYARCPGYMFEGVSVAKHIMEFPVPERSLSGADSEAAAT